MKKEGRKENRETEGDCRRRKGRRWKSEEGRVEEEGRKGRGMRHEKG
jgi:hypothetical protein